MNFFGFYGGGSACKSLFEVLIETSQLLRKVFISCCLFDEQHGRTGSHASFLTKSRGSRTHIGRKA